MNNTIEERDRLEHLISNLIDVGLSLSSQVKPEKLFETIIEKSMAITNSDGGSLYILEKKDNKDFLRFKIAKNYSRNFPFEEFILPVNKESISGYCALSGEILNFESVSAIPEKLGIKYNNSFDINNNYKTVNMLVVPMKNLKGDVIGILQLVNKKLDHSIKLIELEDFDAFITPYTFTQKEELVISSLAAQAAILMERGSLYDDIQQLFKSFIESMVTTLDQRDPATAGHSLRVAKYALQFAKIINVINKDSSDSIIFSQTELDELYYAGLLHDIGKIGVREDVLQKQNKLSKSELLSIKYKLKAYKKDLLIKKITNIINEDEATLYENIDTYFDFIQDINSRNYLSEDELLKIKSIHNCCFTDTEGSLNYILTVEEFEKLNIRKGNLTKEDRAIIQEHPKLTYDILKSIYWGNELQKHSNDCFLSS